MGHPSREEGFVLCSHHCDSDELHQGCYPNLISYPQAAGSVLLINRYHSVSRTLIWTALSRFNPALSVLLFPSCYNLLFSTAAGELR
jgi:hypothetical protein